jgi:site-specific recombinase XerC
VTLPNGKRKAFYGKSRKEVQQKRTAALSDQQKGLPILGERQTVAQVPARWLTDTARHRLRPGTFRRYEELTRLHAVPTLGKLALTKVTPQHLSHLYGAKLAEGLSPRTVEFLHRTLHCALKEAVMWGLLARNPADAVKAPKPKRPPIQPLNPEQAQALLCTADGDPLQALYAWP